MAKLRWGDRFYVTDRKADELDALAVKATELRAPGACDWLQALPIVANMELPTDMLRCIRFCWLLFAHF